MNLDLNPKNGQLRRTKIIATLGPATDDPAVLEAVIRTVIPRNRIVVTATQMMQSMIEHPVPTRAEVLDVANTLRLIRINREEVLDQGAKPDFSQIGM